MSLHMPIMVRLPCVAWHSVFYVHGEIHVCIWMCWTSLTLDPLEYMCLYLELSFEHDKKLIYNLLFIPIIAMYQLIEHRFRIILCYYLPLPPSLHYCKFSSEVLWWLENISNCVMFQRSLTSNSQNSCYHLSRAYMGCQDHILHLFCTYLNIFTDMFLSVFIKIFNDTPASLLNRGSCPSCGVKYDYAPFG